MISARGASLAGIALLAAGFAAPHEAAAADRLPTLEVDLPQTSVSGLSSGAYMAGQFHVAFSATLVGAGLIAGGPYNCAQGQLRRALNSCMETALGPPDAERLVAVARELAEEGKIDPLSGLADDRVYLFSGTQDETVTAPVVASAVEFYRRAGVPDTEIKYVDDLPAGHAFVTEHAGAACATTAAPFINDCDYDQAGDLLQHIYGPLNAPTPEAQAAVVEFDQAEFLPDPTAHGLAETGFVYVPDRCARGEVCRVHVVFHGCQQTVDRIGTAFVTEAGYNRWADSNDLIVLYPQTHETLLNPHACWDWWGYDDPDYATKSGRQMAAVRAMLDRLAGTSGPDDGFCASHSGTNLAHWQAGRARVCNWWFFCAEGSDELLGFMFATSTLYERPEGYFSTQPCPS